MANFFGSSVQTLWLRPQTSVTQSVESNRNKHQPVRLCPFLAVIATTPRGTGEAKHGRLRGNGAFFFSCLSDPDSPGHSMLRQPWLKARWRAWQESGSQSCKANVVKEPETRKEREGQRKEGTWLNADSTCRRSGAKVCGVGRWREEGASGGHGEFGTSHCREMSKEIRERPESRVSQRLSQEASFSRSFSSLRKMSTRVSPKSAIARTLEPEKCEQNTLTRHIFSYLRACLMMSHTTLAQGVSARHTIHVSCACVFDLSSTLSLHSSFSLPSSFSSS